MNILIFNGIFNFHKFFRKPMLCPFIRSRYIDLTVKMPESLSLQTKLSGLFLKCTPMSCWQRVIQRFHLCSFKVRLKVILRGA
jgi:hypothetical protein